MAPGQLLVALVALPALFGAHAKAVAQEPPAPAGIRILGPPPPAAPEVITRDEVGGATLRAVRLTEPPEIDGRLDEEWYRAVPAITGFTQSIPTEGAPATEDTEVWIGFDDANLYVSARLWDSAPESEWIANELRRDTDQLRQNDTFGVAFDTYYDRRNGVMFYTNPLGARAEFAITNEGNPNMDWNPIWDVRTGRFDGGWTAEMRIPFKSLRYRPGVDQVWGIQLRRAIRRRNEWVYITRIPTAASGGGAGGAMRFSLAATLVGLEAPPPSRNLEIKPYIISGIRTDRAVSPIVSNDFYADAGLDVKYGITENLTADFTLNTDFAQVEVDEQQVNLTRFNLLFPEKREFFLEGRGMFEFALAPAGTARAGPNTPSLFFSRRIGLHGGDPVPIQAGVRLTGKVGSFDVGGLNVQTGPLDRVGVRATNFTTLRVRRDVLRRSSVGALYAGRSRSLVGEGFNHTYGVDGTFSFANDLNAIGYYARTETPGLQGGDDSYEARLSYDADRWGLQLGRLLVGQNFNPEVGFLRRNGFHQTSASARASRRPASWASIRRVSLQTNVDYLENAVERFLEARDRQGELLVELENSDVFAATFIDRYERLGQPFRIATGVTIPSGAYAYREGQLRYSLGLNRRFSGNLTLLRGSFYGGDRTSVGIGRGRIGVLRQLSVEPSISFNWVDLPEGSFSRHIASTRVNYSFTPLMFLSGLVQYNTGTDTFTSNVRLRWEYAPGSEIFVVYSDDRRTDVLDRFSELSNRGLVVKVNRMIRP